MLCFVLQTPNDWTEWMNPEYMNESAISRFRNFTKRIFLFAFCDSHFVIRISWFAFCDSHFVIRILWFAFRDSHISASLFVCFFLLHHQGPRPGEHLVRFEAPRCLFAGLQSGHKRRLGCLRLGPRFLYWPLVQRRARAPIARNSQDHWRRG